MGRSNLRPEAPIGRSYQATSYVLSYAQNVLYTWRAAEEGETKPYGWDNALRHKVRTSCGHLAGCLLIHFYSGRWSLRLASCIVLDLPQECWTCPGRHHIRVWLGRAEALYGLFLADVLFFQVAYAAIAPAIFPPSPIQQTAEEGLVHGSKWGVVRIQRCFRSHDKDPTSWRSHLRHSRSKHSLSHHQNY